MKALLVVALALKLFLPATGTSQRSLPPNQSTGSCPVTVAPQQPFTPPAPYPAKAPSPAFWYGHDHLWTMLGPDGTWHGLPRNEAGLRQKVFWWYPGFDARTEPVPNLVVTGRQLDGNASFVHPRATNANHPDFGGWAILTGIDIPNAGCWELTSHYRGHTLSFVVAVS